MVNDWVPYFPGNALHRARICYANFVRLSGTCRPLCISKQLSMSQFRRLFRVVVLSSNRVIIVLAVCVRVSVDVCVCLPVCPHKNERNNDQKLLQ